MVSGTSSGGLNLVNSWKVILATMVIFGTGVVTGGLVVHYSMPTRRAPAPSAPRPQPTVSPGGMRIELLRRMERELDLTPHQRAQVDKVIKEGQERTHKIMEPVAPQMLEELQRTREQFRALLTPDQQARFDQMLKQQHPREKSRPPARDKMTENSNGLAPSGVLDRRP